jgi:hypothetical protein
MANPKTFEAPIIPERLFDNTPFFVVNDEPEPQSLMSIQPKLPVYKTIDNVRTFQNPLVYQEDPTNAAFEKVWVDTSISNRNIIQDSLNMKNQWRDNMLRQAPISTFGGRIFSPIK